MHDAGRLDLRLFCYRTCICLKKGYPQILYIWFIRSVPYYSCPFLGFHSPSDNAGLFADKSEYCKYVVNIWLNISVFFYGMFDISLFAFKGDCWWVDNGKHHHVGNPMIHLPLRMVYTCLYQPYDHMVIFGMDTYGDFWDGLFMFFL